MVLIVIPIGAKLAVAQPVVESDRALVIFTDFQAHDDTASVHRFGFRLTHQFLAHTPAPNSR
jgi:hypothetical protein